MYNRRNSPPITEEYNSSTSTTTTTGPTITRSRSSSNSLASVSSINGLNGILSSPSTTTAAASTISSSTAVLASGYNSGNSSPVTTPSTNYYPAFPIRNKSRTPSVSSTSTITQPIHSLLQTSTGILPKRHAAPVSAAPTLSTVSASHSPPSSALSSPTKSDMASGNGLQNNTSSLDSGNSNGRPTASTSPILVLEPIQDNFALKSLELQENTRIKIGRQTGVATAPSPTNGYFDSKVLSRVHAEVWSDNGKVFIRDLKSSNGTFLNGKRLCAENVESEPFVLNQNDQLEFGIDILDESGSMLHEKVACKIYISRMSSYPTPKGSPQETPAKLQSGSPTESGPSSIKSTAAGGQGTNIDLIISRLQNELTRSQETNADLGSLKQGLGELERAITTPPKEDTNAETESQDQSQQFQKLIEESQAIHAAEIAKLNKELGEAQSEIEAYIQKIHILEPLVSEDEILKRDIAQSTAELTQVKLERDLAKDSMNDLINDHQQSISAMRKEHEAMMTAMEENHKENLERLNREATLARELITQKHEEDLAAAIQSAPQTEQALEALKSQLESLQATVENQVKLIQELTLEKKTLSQQLAETKAEVIKVEKKLDDSARSTKESLSSLTPTLTSTSTFSCKHPECRDGSIITTSKSTTASAKGLVARPEFSWTQFVFSYDKHNASRQPSMVVMSGGIMLVGLGVFVAWRKAGLR
ncbi:hypothetical protein BGZ76_010024 [Entomortierella beljakovae]|nr:hypothetical protein BGZ76_010024 [Entomortierella beljakovae]